MLISKKDFVEQILNPTLALVGHLRLHAWPLLTAAEQARFEESIVAPLLAVRRYVVEEGREPSPGLVDEVLCYSDAVRTTLAGVPDSHVQQTLSQLLDFPALASRQRAQRSAQYWPQLAQFERESPTLTRNIQAGLRDPAEQAEVTARAGAEEAVRTAGALPPYISVRSTSTGQLVVTGEFHPHQHSGKGAATAVAPAHRTMSIKCLPAQLQLCILAVDGWVRDCAAGWNGIAGALNSERDAMRKPG